MSMVLSPKSLFTLALRCSVALVAATGFAHVGLAQPSQQPAAPAKASNPLDALPDFFRQGPKPIDLKAYPWLDPKLEPDRRAAMVLSRMTLDEKIGLMHGVGFGNAPPENSGVGYVPGIERLKVPALSMADSTVGVAKGQKQSRYATLMPATIAEASTWDPQVAFDYGQLVGRELRAHGFNVSLAGGVNLTREPRNGRSFEYRGEDPLLAGKLVAGALRGLQGEHLIGDIKHFALNDQETGRHVGNVLIDYAAARESDLLAFEIGVREGKPGLLMCAYNKVWGRYSCENDELLNRTLKQEWGYEGWVVSDWAGTHSTGAALRAGLDQEQPGQQWFGPTLKAEVEAGTIPVALVDGAVRRILRTMFASGIVDFPPERQVVDVDAGLVAAQRIEELGAVLLKNENGMLPLARSARRIAVIGSHADVGVLTGGGSGQVDPPGGSAVKTDAPRVVINERGITFTPVWYPSSPLKALREALPGVEIVYDGGDDPARAARTAQGADLAIVFAHQPSAEERDNDNLSLPGNQNALIDAVAGANPRTVVALETSGPVTMPWLDKVPAVAEFWFPGARGGQAIARLLIGQANFAGKLPVTFPRAEVDLPHPVLAGTDIPWVRGEGVLSMIKSPPPFDIRYDEGSLVGYKWYEAKGKPVLFPFGHGLSYTSYAYSGVRAGPTSVSFTIRNTGGVAGMEIAQVYASLPVPGQPRRLVGWTKVQLRPGESREVTVAYEPLALSVYDTAARRWKRPRGRFALSIGPSSATSSLKATVVLR